MPVAGPAKVQGADWMTIVAVAMALPLAVLCTAILLAAIRLPVNALVSPVEQQGVQPAKQKSETPAPPSKKSGKSKPPSNTHSAIPPSRPPEPAAPASAGRIESPPAIADARPEVPEEKKPATDSKPGDAARSPLAEAYDREVYGFLSELKAAIESQAWEDAARLLTAPRRASNSGIAPSMFDKSLATSLPVAMQLAHEEHHELRRALGEQYGTLAELRTAQAIRSADPAAIELAAVQFIGAPAAAKAHAWLADEAFAAGRFERAVVHYQSAAEADTGMASQVAPRLRLAFAMCGRDAGAPATSEVKFSEQVLAADEFETLVAEMRLRHSVQNSSVRASDYGHAPPPPGRFQSRTISAPPHENTSPLGEARDTIDRHAALIDGDTAYLCDGVRLAAHNIARGEKQWELSVAPSSQTGRRALAKARPIIQGERIFIRTLDLSGPHLVCLEKTSGARRWATEYPDRVRAISDPVLVEGQIATLSLIKETDQLDILRLHIFDRRTGQQLLERDVVSLRGLDSPSCEVISEVGNLIVATNGTALACDVHGDIRWIRTLTTEVPNSIDQRPAQQPLVQEGRVYIAHVGGKDLFCLDAATGRQHWTISLSEAATLAGAYGPTLVVLQSGGVVGLSKRDGAEQWRFSSKKLTSHPLGDARHVLVAEIETTPPSSGKSLQLTWLDAVNGEPTSTTHIAELATESAQLRALLPYKSGLLGWQGNANEPEFFELLPGAQASRRAKLQSHAASTRSAL